MTETTDILAKKADAADLIADLATIREKLELLRLESRWFGGLPPAFEQLHATTEHHARAISSVFQLPSE